MRADFWLAFAQNPAASLNKLVAGLSNRPPHNRYGGFRRLDFYQESFE